MPIKSKIKPHLGKNIKIFISKTLCLSLEKKDMWPFSSSH